MNTKTFLCLIIYCLSFWQAFYTSNVFALPFHARVATGLNTWNSPALDHISQEHFLGEWVEVGFGPLSSPNADLTPGLIIQMPDLYYGQRIQTPLIHHQSTYYRLGIQWPLWRFADQSDFTIEIMNDHEQHKVKANKDSHLIGQRDQELIKKDGNFKAKYTRFEVGALWQPHSQLLNELGILYRVQKRFYSARVPGYPRPGVYEGLHRLWGIRLGHRSLYPAGLRAGYRAALLAGSLELSDRQTRSHQYSRDSKWIEGELQLTISYSRAISPHRWWYFAIRPEVSIGRQPRLRTNELVMRTSVDYSLTAVFGFGAGLNPLP